MRLLVPSYLFVVPAPMPLRSPHGRNFYAALRVELPDALRKLQQGNIAPVDLAQAAIGPGMAVFSRYSRVVEADGSAMRVRSALGLINQVLDETLAEQEADFDAETRWALAWFEENGMKRGPVRDGRDAFQGEEHGCQRARRCGHPRVQGGQGQIARPHRSSSVTGIRRPTVRLTVWEVTQHLIQVLLSRVRSRRRDCSAASVALAKQRESWLTGSTCSATVRNGHRRRSPTTRSSSPGQRSLAWLRSTVWHLPVRGCSSLTVGCLMAMTNHERIGKALTLLSEGLAPFVARECQAKYGEGWVQSISRMDPAAGASGKKVSPTDAQFLLKVMWDEWQSVFRTVLGQTDRTYVSELRDVRNRWAHQDTFSTDDAERALDTMRRLLLAISAPEAAVELDKMRQELRRLQILRAGAAHATEVGCGSGRGPASRGTQTVARTRHSSSGRGLRPIPASRVCR